MQASLLYPGTNLAKVVMSSPVLKVLGVEPYPAQQGVPLNLTGLLDFAALR